MVQWMSLLLLLLVAMTGAPQSDRYNLTPMADNQASLSAYPDFAKIAEPGPLIPGLQEGLVPQGITWLPEQGWFVFAGYHSDGRASALIAIDAESGTITRQVSLLNTDGSPYTGHAGGVCATDTALYISNQHRLFRLPLQDFLAAKAPVSLAFDAEIPVPNNASYCSCQDGWLWVGEFRHGSSYTTDATHHLSFGGEKLGAWLCGYRLSETGEGPAAGDLPDVILETPDRVQGMTMLNGQIWLSQSYGRKNSSTLCAYADPSDTEPDQMVILEGHDIPLWFLLSSRQQDRIIVPPMTECLCAAKGSVWVLFESAALPYMDPSNPSRSPIDRLMAIGPSEP